MIIMIILLILCLPLILMLSLFTTTNVVTIVADVPVTGIEITMDKNEIPVLSLDDGDTIRVDYMVMPNGASKKDVNYYFNSIGEEPMAEFDVDGNLLTPTSHGKTKVTVETVDGGFRDSFIIYVTTKKVTAIDCTVPDTITVGSAVKIETVFTPAKPYNNSLTYSIKEGHDVISLNNGEIKGIGIGTAIVEIVSGDNPEVKDEVVINVESSGVFDYINIDNFATLKETSGWVDVVFNPILGNIGYDIQLEHIADGEDSVNPDDIINVVLNKEEGRLEYEFKDPDFIGTIRVDLTVTAANGSTKTEHCTITRLSEVTVEWIGDAEYSNHGVVWNSEPLLLGISVKPSVAHVTYKVSVKYTANSGLVGDVSSGDEIILEEGKTYTCNGGYISFTLKNNTIEIVGAEPPASLDKISETVTTLRISAIIEGEGGESTLIDLGRKKISVGK